MRADVEEVFVQIAHLTGVRASHQRDDFLERVLSVERAQALLSEGRVWNGAQGQLEHAENAKCHQRAIEISERDPRYAWWCGFAWAAADPRNTWVLHSWLLDPDDRVLELTIARRNWYFGKAIHQAERGAWAEALREDPPDFPAFILDR
jgi:hypothetical protein